MAQPLAYRVVVTTSRGLNIMLTNKREAQLRTYSHFVKQEEARDFADTLQKCLSDADYSDLERCPICGEAFTRQNRLCRLKDSRIVQAGRKILCKRFSTKSRMVLESRADSGLNPLITESHGGQNGMRAGAA